MNTHLVAHIVIVLYLALTLAYVEAAIHSFWGRKLHNACRETLIAGVYIGILLLTLLGLGLHG